MRNREEFLELSTAARTFIQAIRKFEGEVDLSLDLFGMISDIDDTLWDIKDELEDKEDV